MIPSFSNEISFTAAASFTIVMINSEFSAISFGDVTTLAPFSLACIVFSFVLLYTVTSKPESSKCKATAFPNIPSPIIPIFFISIDSMQ